MVIRFKDPPRNWTRLQVGAYNFLTSYLNSVKSPKWWDIPGGVSMLDSWDTMPLKDIREVAGYVKSQSFPNKSIQILGKEI